MPSYFAERIQEFQEIMTKCEFVIGVDKHASIICEVVDALMAKAKVDALGNQFMTYEGEWAGSSFVDSGSIQQSGYSVSGTQMPEGMQMQSISRFN